MIRLNQLTKLLPQLTYKAVKGGNGRVGVIGGSFQYTGAPFYAAMGALKMGADLAHIFCAKQAAIPIKSYSPQVIVHPVFNYDSQTVDSLTEPQIQLMTSKWVEYMKGKFDKIQSWVIGPGLGRSKCLNLFFQNFIQQLPKKTSLVIDADGLYFLCQSPHLMKKLAQLNCVLTPNNTEFKHLNKLLQIDANLLKIDQSKQQQNKQMNQKNEQNGSKIVAFSKKINKDLPATVLIKGEHDIILDKKNLMTIVKTQGSKKRCGGIGDVLSGCLAASILWNYQKGPILASYTVKRTAKIAYDKHGRSLTGLGVLQQLSTIVKSLQ